MVCAFRYFTWRPDGLIRSLVVTGLLSGSCVDLHRSGMHLTTPAPGDFAQADRLSLAQILDPHYLRSKYDIPIVYNARVAWWLHYFQGNGRPTMQGWLSDYARYAPMMREILTEEGAPSDLVFVAMIESGFDMSARSQAAAAGPWQFIDTTASIYGVDANDYVDARLDPVASTRGAARHLRDLYTRFGNWHLAIAAYNAGGGLVSRAASTFGASDYWALSDAGALCKETRQYLPKILAAAIIAKHPETFGFSSVGPSQTFEYETVLVPASTHLKSIACVARVSAGDLEALNPALRQSQTPPHGEWRVRVPKGAAASVRGRVADGNFTSACS